MGHGRAMGTDTCPYPIFDLEQKTTHSYPPIEYLRQLAEILTLDKY